MYLAWESEVLHGFTREVGAPPESFVMLDEEDDEFLAVNEQEWEPVEGYAVSCFLFVLP